MRAGRILVMLTAVGVLAGAGWVTSQHRGGQPELTGADIAEIQQLYARYSQGRDWDDEELFLTAWADDAVFTEGNGAVHAGIEGIRAQFREESASGVNDRITHDNPNILIWRDAEGVVHGRGVLERARRHPNPAAADADGTLFRHVQEDARRLAHPDSRVDTRMGLAHRRSALAVPPASFSTGAGASP